MKQRPRNPNTKSRQKKIHALQAQVSELKKELAHERRENARLKQKINHLKGTYGETPELSIRDIRQRRKSDPLRREQEDLWGAGAINARRFSKQNYFLFLLHSIKESTLGLIFRRIARYFRRWRLFRNVAMILGAVLAAVVLSAFFITAIPFLLLFLGASLAAIVFRARKANRRMKAALSGVSRIRVIFFHEQITFGENSFCERSAMSMAKDKDTAVVVVTPHLWSKAGLGGRGMYVTSREEQPRLFLVRQGYYFILKRKVFSELSADLTLMYG